jgi:hypothetical protein
METGQASCYQSLHEFTLEQAIANQPVFGPAGGFVGVTNQVLARRVFSARAVPESIRWIAGGRGLDGRADGRRQGADE